ncbi:MAG: thioredoxin family protein [Micavibrio sp.]
MLNIVLALVAALFLMITTAPGNAAAPEAVEAEAAAEAPGATVGSPAPDFTATDSNGDSVTLSGLKGKTVVLEWTNAQCPFVRKFYDTNTMQALQKDAADQGIVWLTVNSAAAGKQGHVDGPAANKIIADENANQTAYLLDSSGAVGRLYNASTTPHMFVINPEGTLVYAGGIDDQPSVTHNSLEGANNYVKAALADLAAGQQVKVATSKPYGCAVKY